MSITLYEVRPTRSARVRWTLLELGIPFKSIEGPQLFRSPELEAISPLGKVPAIVADGRPLFESAAICTWLADSRPERGLTFQAGSWERALQDQWIAFCLTEIEAHLWSTARNTRVYPEGRREAGILAQNEAEGRRSLAVLERHLAAEPFLVAGRFTVADIIMGYVTSWARMQGWTTDLPHCEAYTSRLLAMPLCPYGQD